MSTANLTQPTIFAPFCTDPLLCRVVALLRLQLDNIQRNAHFRRCIDEVLIEQIAKQAPFLKQETITILDDLKKGNTVEEFNPMLNSLSVVCQTANI